MEKRTAVEKGTFEPWMIAFLLVGLIDPLSDRSGQVVCRGAFVSTPLTAHTRVMFLGGVAGEGAGRGFTEVV